MGRAALLLLVLCILLTGASSVRAQAYRWQDEQGQIHFTDDPSQIPPRFRRQVEQLELPEPTYTPREQAAAPGGSESALAQALDDALRTEWPDVPAAKRHAAAAAIVDRLPLLLVALAIHTLATLAMFGHAVASGERLWALGNLLVPFVPPLYALLKLEGAALKKAGIVVAWATGPAAGVALQLAIAQIAA